MWVTAAGSARARAVPCVGLFLVASFLWACASPPVVPTPAVEDRALRTKAEREETTLLERSRRLDDIGVRDYLAQVVERLAPDATRAPGPPRPRVVVLRDPTLAAFAIADGLVVVHVGLLSSLASEDELALILARELVHVSEGHAGRPTADAQRSSCAASAQAARSRTGTIILSRRLPEMKLASMIGYGPALERTTDVSALERVALAGYDPAQAAGAFPRLRDIVGADGTAEPFLLGCPTWLDERSASFQDLLARRGSVALRSPVTTPDEFARRVRPAVRESALLDAQSGRFDAARRHLDRVLAVEPDDAVAYVYEGDVRRLQAQASPSKGDRVQLLEKARESYERAAALDPRAGMPYRQLGLLFYQEGAVAQAREAFEKYLSLSPDAPDAPRIREYVTELRR
jgi:predicted Zn-dependent protease